MLSSEKKFIHKIETTTHEDAEENISQTKKETITKLHRSDEPDYIKLYTRLWAEFNDIPIAYRELFLQLVLRMSYADATTKSGGQIVFTSEPNASDIKKVLNWSSREMYQKGLNALVKCNAIKRVARGAYQINPSYADKGEWKFNPRLKHGGIEDLTATFNFKKKTVDTKIVWADDGKPSAFNQSYREGMGVKDSDETVLKHTTIVGH